MAKTLMAVDAGTGSVRAVLFSLEGEQLGCVQQEWTHREDPRYPGSMDFDWVHNWDLARGCIRGVIEQTGVDPHDIAAVSTTCMREGIVLYDRRQPHAVLLTDYTDGVFYCSDPAGSVSSGRVPISAASISIAGASCYWYISSDHNSAVATLDSLRLEGMRYPVNIRTGKGMSVSGTAASASGAVLSSVEAAILDANDQPVQSAEASPNVSSWSLKNFDSQLRFGELPEGSYTYMVVLTDSNGQTLCFMSDFTVSGSASSTATYWTVQDPSGTKLGQLVQETEEAVAQAVESEAEAVTETKKGMWSWLLG